MKIGIITYHRAHNYGAVLQCYALKEVLRNMGYNTQVIDYFPSYFKKEYSQFSLSKIKGMHIKKKIGYILKHLLTFWAKSKRCRVFDDFISKLPLTQKQYNEACVPPKGFDAIFFGSDQVWNPLLTKGEDNIFCGNFNKQNCKFISYAASTNPKLLNEEYREYFQGIINRFDAISVREQSLNSYLNMISPGCSQVVLDPVLLLDKELWSKIAVKPKEDNYLLIYTVPQSGKVWELARMIAKEKGLRIIEIRPKVGFEYKKNILQYASPAEFLGYFKYASYIVTTSFHGTAFSVKFEKEFVTLKFGTPVDDRAKNLLASIGAEDRMVSINNLQIPSHQADYKCITPKLQKHINESINFIKYTLQNGN